MQAFGMGRTDCRIWRIRFGTDIWLKFGEANIQHRTFRNDDRALDYILEFSNIARPVIPDQSLHRFRKDGVNHAIVPPAELLHEVPDEQGNIFFSLAERRIRRDSK